MMPGQMRVDSQGRTVTLIHFVYATGRKLFYRDSLHAEYVLACQPMSDNPAMQRTNECRAVNCPECKKSEKWKMAARANGVVAK